MKQPILSEAADGATSKLSDTMTDLKDIRLERLSGRGSAVYENKLKSLLEPEHKGRFVAIEPDTESYFLGKSGTEAILKARAALPDKLFYLMRVGYRAACSIGGSSLRMRRTEPRQPLSKK